MSATSAPTLNTLPPVRPRQKFSKSEAEKLAAALMKEHEELPITPSGDGPLDVTTLTKAIERRERLPLKGSFYSGIVYPDGRVVRTDSETAREKFLDKRSMGHSQSTLERIVEVAIQNLPKDAIPQEGLPIIIRHRDPESDKAVKKFIEEELIPHFLIKKKVKLSNGDEKDIMATVVWPFIEAAASGRVLNEQAKGLYEHLEQLPVFQINCPTASPETEKKMKEAFKGVHRMLAAMEVGRAYYLEGLELKEALETAAIAATVGVGGELAIHHYLHDSGGAAMIAARTGVLSLIDLIENFLNARGLINSERKANGLGHKSLKSPEVKPIRNRAVKAAAQGTVLGAGLSAGAGTALSGGMAVAVAAPLAGLGATGTATGVPLSVRMTLEQLYLGTLEAMKKGLIPIPTDLGKGPPPKPDILKMMAGQSLTTKQLTEAEAKQLRQAEYYMIDKAVRALLSGEKPPLTHQEKVDYDLKKHAMEIALRELSCREVVGASVSGFVLLPFISGGIIASQLVGVDQATATRAFMFLVPPMESFLRILFTLKKLFIGNPARMAAIEDRILTTPDEPLTAIETKMLTDKFSSPFSRLALRIVTKFKKMKEPAELPVPNTPN